MKRFILSGIICLAIFVLVQSCQKENSDDELAERISKSENFKSIMNFWKSKVDYLIKIPDSNKNKLRTLKVRIESVQKDKNLNVYQKSDSLIKITNLIKAQSLFDSSFYNDAMITTPVYKKFYDEFPEYKRLSV